MVKNIVPDWLKGDFSKDDFPRIEKAIAAAEMQTSGEIVPMIVPSSSSTTFISLIVFLILWNIVLVADLLATNYIDDLYSPAWLHIIYFFVTVVISRFIADMTGVKRLFLDLADSERQVKMRAENEFYKAGLQKTVDGTGVLIFLSMLEHRVVVLADQSIAEKLPADTWDELVKNMLQDIKNGNITLGLEKAILRCGELLKPHFPRAEDDVNELKDQLIIKSE